LIFWKKKYNIDIDILSSGDITLINTFLPSGQKRLGLKPENIYNNEAKLKLEKNYMIINVIAYIDDVEIEGEKFENASVDMPKIKYTFK